MRVKIKITLLILAIIALLAMLSYAAPAILFLLFHSDWVAVDHLLTIDDDSTVLRLEVVDGKGTVLWAIENPAQGYVEHIDYGVLPRGFVRRLPVDGGPRELESGEPLGFSYCDFEGGGAFVQLKVKRGGALHHGLMYWGRRKDGVLCDREFVFQDWTVPSAGQLRRGLPVPEAESKGQVMAWATTDGKRYLLPDDSCYGDYQRWLATDRAQYFHSALEAERSGFQRRAVGLVPLKKYADVCSHLYEYALASVCEKVFLDDPGRGGFVPIERFTTLANLRVVGVVRSRTYLTPCDKDYQCLIAPKEGRSSECERLAESTGPMRVFSSERMATDAGYMSVAEVYFSEVVDDHF